MKNNSKEKEHVNEELTKLDKILHGQKEMLIITHNNPDPDAIATAAALSYLAEKRCNVKTSIAFGGYIGRAENQAMVKTLQIPLKQVNRVRLEKYDRIAMVDTQPGAGNHSLPPNTQCHIVVDHHPKRPNSRIDFEVIKPKIGVSATIMIEWLKESRLDIPPNLATALTYAISSETQNLGRETSARDIQAYLYVYVKANMRKLAQILYPKLPRPYFHMLSRALENARTFRNLVCTHLGHVNSPDVVSEMADFLLRHERISWSLSSGRFKTKLYISVRSSNPKAQAGHLVKQLVPNPHTVGGHDLIAGGYIELNNGKKDTLEKLEDNLSRNFARLMGYDEVEWKPLLDSKTIKTDEKKSRKN